MDEKERKAFEGDAQAQCDMGDDYFFEAFDADIEDKDVLYRKAIYWYHRAAQKGHAASQYNLAYQYEHGLGIEIDLEQAVYWYNVSKFRKTNKRPSRICGGLFVCDLSRSFIPLGLSLRRCR